MFYLAERLRSAFLRTKRKERKMTKMGRFSTWLKNFERDNVSEENFSTEKLQRKSIREIDEENERKLNERAERLFSNTMEKEKVEKTTRTKEESENDNSIFSDKAYEKTTNIISISEDIKTKAYKPTPNDVWTIGYGHTSNVKEGDEITEEEAKELLKKDIEIYKKPLNKVKVPLNDNEKAALTSFIYNNGANAFEKSTLLKKLNQGDRKGAADEFDKWVYQGKTKLKGLVNRRAREKELFLSVD